MKAALCKSYGPPKSLVIEDIEEPQPGAGEVVVKIDACGINFPDVLLMAGKYQMKPDMPFSPGGEIAGEILSVGAEVDSHKPGDRVLALTGFGGLREQLAIDARRVFPLPESIDTVSAAAFTTTYATSYHALKQRAKLQSGESLLVLGAAGGVGLTAVELGRLAGARVTAAASSDDKLALAREYGAENTINYSTTSLKAAAKELTAGRGYDVIYDPVGGDLFDDCLRSVGWNGRVLVVGFASGEIPKAPTNLTLLKGSSIIGVFWGRFTEVEPAAHLENMRELFAMHAEGKIRPCVSTTFSLEDAGEAIDLLANRKAKGKVVVQM